MKWLLWTLVYSQLPQTFKVLGPFPIGTRELGYSPISLDSLQHDTDQGYLSELGNNGLVYWKTITTNSNVVTIQHDDVDWSLFAGMGVSALQHTTFLKSVLEISTTGTYLFDFKGLVSFKVDDMVFPADPFYSAHSSISSVYLSQGTHELLMQLVYDPLVHELSVPPKSTFQGSIELVNESVIGVKQDTILPELMDGEVVSPFGSVTIHNTHSLHPSTLLDTASTRKKMKNEPGWKQIIRVSVYDPTTSVQIPVRLPTLFTMYVSPGQTLPVPFQLLSTRIPNRLKITVEVMDLDTEVLQSIDMGEFDVKERKWGSAYKVTMEGYDSSVQEVYLKPPKRDCLGFQGHKCPVVVALRGSPIDRMGQLDGLEECVHSVEQQEYAWVVFPTGRTRWGDWHGPSFQNIQASIAVLDLMYGVPRDLRSSIQADLDRLVVMGHGSGGYGAWWYATHQPDKVMAVVPASAFLKLQTQLPYFLTMGYAYTDPTARGILASAMAENDLDLYASNAGGIPVLVRTGGRDVHTPAFFSRRMVRLLDEWNGGNNVRYCFLMRYVEDQDKGHWYEGILNDQVIQSFLDQFLDPKRNPALELPSLPNPFTFTTMNPGSSGTRGGIRILQLMVPYRLASITVEQIGSHWKLRTSNVRRFGFVRDPRQNGIRTWSIDDTEFDQPPLNAGPSYLKTGNYTWEVAEDLLWISRERSPMTYGPISQIFSQPLRIVVPSSPTANLTLYRELARDITTQWYIYTRGTTQIIRDVDVLDGFMARYNLIVLGDPRDNFYTMRRSQGGAARLVTYLSNGAMQIGERTYDDPGTGVLFLAPSPARTRLCLFVSGIDEEGLRRAVWTIPFRTGLQVADYTIVGDSYGDPAAGWTQPTGKRTKGAGGILATGFWGNDWNFEKHSGYLK